MSKGTDLYQLQAQMRFSEAAPLAIAARADTLFEHEEGTRSGEDAEDLHDMRVASRRLRAAMTIFAPSFPKRVFRPLQKEAAQLTRALGAVRDTDVILEELRRNRNDLPADEVIGIDDLLQAVSADRATQRDQLVETLDQVARQGFLQRLRMAVWGDRHHPSHRKADHTTLGDAAQRISVQRIADLYGFAPYVHDPARVEELHEMRKAAKHLRYSLEIFRPCFGKEIDGLIDDIKDIQDQIGKIHDRDVLIDLMRDHLARYAMHEHEQLLEIALAPQPHIQRMKRIHGAIDTQTRKDPRIGILALLGRKREERDKRYADFVQWWDEQDKDGLRAKLYDGIIITAQPPASGGTA